MANEAVKQVIGFLASMAGSYKYKEDWKSVLGQPTCSIFTRMNVTRLKTTDIHWKCQTKISLCGLQSLYWFHLNEYLGFFFFFFFVETRELYWLHIVLQSQQTALEPEDTCRQAASTIHMHPRSPESLLMALPWFPATGSGLLSPVLGAGM